MENFRGLKVTAKARALAVLVYQVTAGFPPAELFSMTRQMRRAAVSIGLNIAEGCGRGTTPDLIRFLIMANGSAQELEFAALQSIDLGFAPDQQMRRIIDGAIELQKMLCALIKRLRNP